MKYVHYQEYSRKSGHDQDFSRRSSHDQKYSRRYSHDSEDSRRYSHDPDDSRRYSHYLEDNRRSSHDPESAPSNLDKENWRDGVGRSLSYDHGSICSRNDSNRVISLFTRISSSSPDHEDTYERVVTRSSSGILPEMGYRSKTSMKTYPEHGALRPSGRPRDMRMLRVR